MAEIATIDEFASAIRKTVEFAQGHKLPLDLACGLVADELGEQDPWPTVAKSVALAAAARAFFNPQGLSQEILDGSSATRESAEVGVYLTDSELKRLHRWAAGNLGRGKPTFSFPGTWPHPDPVERDPGMVTG
jgi:hypothetical protein